MRSILGWTALALLGLALAAGVTLAASELSSQKIGLQSEPLDAGRDLAPPDGDDAGPVPQEPRTTTQSGDSSTDDTAGGSGSGSGDADAGSGGSDDSAAPARSDDRGGTSDGQAEPGGNEPDSDD